MAPKLETEIATNETASAIIVEALIVCRACWSHSIVKLPLGRELICPKCKRRLELRDEPKRTRKKAKS